MATLRFEVAFCKASQRLREQRECTDYRDHSQIGEYRSAADEAETTVKSEGIFAVRDLHESLFEYLNLSIDEALTSQNPIIRAFAVLDKRCGKRRLLDFELASEHPLVSQFHLFRCHVEGLRPGLQVDAAVEQVI